MKRLIPILMALFIYGCQDVDPVAEVQAAQTVTPAPSLPAPTQDLQTQEWRSWDESAHAHTYDLSKGPNTYCAQCHSPFNWDPGARIGEPPNCVSCKLPSEELPRLSEQNPLVPEGDWQNIGCAVCHVSDGGQTSAAIAWWDQASGRYMPVADSTDLCNQCHRDTQVLRHRFDPTGSAHAGFGCVDCHDPHSTAASCSDAGCHAGIWLAGDLLPATPPGGHPDMGSAFCGGPSCHAVATQVALSTSSIHGSLHAAVDCAACHDAGGLEVGPLDTDGRWVTFRTTEIDEVRLTLPYESHDLQVEVDCGRCHFKGNPWGLQMVSGREFGESSP
jgi:hypothetical protein